MPALNSSITIMDVARKVGVSHTTVSLALRNSDRISHDVAERIRAVAQEMGYRPKIAAQLLRGNHTGRVALVIPRGITGTHPGFFSMVLSHFVQACETHEIGYHVELLDSQADAVHELPDSVAGGLVDGVILVGWFNDSLKQVLARNNCPWVSIEEPDEFSVSSSFSDGVYGAVQHLAALGHRHVALMAGDTRYLVHNAVRQGFERAVAEFSLRSLVIPYAVPKEDTRPCFLATCLLQARQFMELTDKPTAVVSSTMLVVRHLILLAMQNGTRIPQDLSLIAIGHSGDAQAMWPIITSVQSDWGGLASNALGMVMQLVARKKLSENHVMVPTRLVEGDTVGPPRSAT